MTVETRKEYKNIADEKYIVNFFTKYSEQIKEVHEPRIITSLYFDTADFESYKFSKLFDVDTFKLRIRTYSNDKSFYKEIKSNLSTGKNKRVEKLSIQNFDEWLPISIDGKFFYPSLFTEYERKYFNFENGRITLDNKIIFRSHPYRTLTPIEFNFRKSIIEYKNLEKFSEIEKYLDKNPVAFSKYNFAVENLYRIQIEDK